MIFADNFKLNLHFDCIRTVYKINVFTAIYIGQVSMGTLLSVIGMMLRIRFSNGS